MAESKLKWTGLLSFILTDIWSKGSCALSLTSLVNFQLLEWQIHVLVGLTTWKTSFPCLFLCCISMLQQFCYFCLLIHWLGNGFTLLFSSNDWYSYEIISRIGISYVIGYWTTLILYTSSKFGCISRALLPSTSYSYDLSNIINKKLNLLYLYYCIFYCSFQKLAFINVFQSQYVRIHLRAPLFSSVVINYQKFLHLDEHIS